MRDHLTLPNAVATAIRKHGEEAYPHECCGALVGKGGRVETAVPLPNSTKEGPRRRFLVEPSDHRFAERLAGELGAELLGFYHSHPDHPAQPSQYDLDNAWPTFAYLIVSVVEGNATRMTVWRLKDDRSTFEEGELHGDEDPDSHTTAAVYR